MIKKIIAILIVNAMFKKCLQNDKIVKKSAQLEGTNLPKTKVNRWKICLTTNGQKGPLLVSKTSK